MQRFRIVYTETARDDLIVIGDYIRDAAGDVVADRFIGRVMATVESLETSPRRYRERPALGLGIRATGYRKYMIFYRVEQDSISIVRVLHGARRITANLIPQ